MEISLGLAVLVFAVPAVGFYVAKKVGQRFRDVGRAVTDAVNHLPETEYCDTDISWPELIKCVEEQYGFDLQDLVERYPDILLEEFNPNIEAQFGIDLGETLCNIKVDVTAVTHDGTVVDCTIGG